MPCYHPLPAWYARRVNPETRKRGVVFRLADGLVDKPLEVPCGKCIGCQLEKSRQWAMRCIHEAKMWERNCFITLTYDDDHLPPGGSLRPKDFVDFMKRLRWHAGPEVRFFHCGEYGDQLGRPHHHAILFNHEFTDLRFYKEDNGVPLFTSATLEKLWGHGLCSVGDVTFESAAYVARYALKKITGPAAEAHYAGRHPEYLTMSRRPGIGRAFVDKYRKEIYRDDSCVVRGAECKPPRYYDSVQGREAPAVLAKVKARRRQAAAADVNSTGQRLNVRETVKEASITFLKRGLT